MSGFGQDAWLTTGHALLTVPIKAEEYMSLLLERQEVYRATTSPEIAWVKPLIEWFCWPEDNDLVILPDRTTAEPKSTRTNADRLADAEAAVALWTERLARAEARLRAAVGSALPDSDDTAIINIPRSRKAWQRVDASLDRCAQAGRVRDNARDKLTMAQSRVRKYRSLA